MRTTPCWDTIANLIEETTMLPEPLSLELEQLVTIANRTEKIVKILATHHADNPHGPDVYEVVQQISDLLEK